MILADTFRGIIFCKEPMGEAKACPPKSEGGGFRDPTIQTKKQPENIRKLKNYPPEKNEQNLLPFGPFESMIFRTSRFGRICDRSLKIHEQLVQQKIHLVKENEKHPTKRTNFFG